MSIIVALYNLHLKDDPKGDKQKISDFLRTYTPRIFKYETADDFSSSFKRDDNTGTYIPDSKHSHETLGWYEYSFNRSWFDDNADVFYALYNPTRRIVDKFLNSKQSVSKEDALWVNDLLKHIILTLAIVENQKELITFKQFPESIKLEKYTFGMTPALRTSEINKNLEESIEKIIQWNFPEIEYQLFWDFINLWNNRLNLKRCAFPGSKKKPICNNIFIQKAKRHKFCSDECRLEYNNSKKAEYMREKRNPNSPKYNSKYI